MTTPRPPPARWPTLAAAGVSLWLDDLSRQRLQSGNLKDLIADPEHRRGHHQPVDLPGRADRRRRPTRSRSVNSPPAAPTSTTPSARSPPTTSGTPATCSPPPSRPPGTSTAGSPSRSTRDSRTTPRRTIAQAQELHKIVDRPNLLIKIPATLAGLPAITAVIAEGISVNVTLIFSLDRYKAVMDAYLDRSGAGQGGRPRPLPDPLRRVVLRLPGRHRDRQAAQGHRHPGGRGPRGRGRDRERPAGLPGVRADLRR